MAGIDQIVELLKSKPELGRPLDGVSDLDQAADELARIASANGIEATSADIRPHLRSLPSKELSDEELDGVSGGFVTAIGLGVILIGGTIAVGGSLGALGVGIWKTVTR